MNATVASVQPPPVAPPTENGIVEPGDGGVVGGVIAIKGIATDPSFHKWQLDLLLFGDEQQAVFVALSSKPRATLVTLTQLDTTRYPNGAHKLRLRVVRADSNYNEYFVSLVIANP